MCSLPNTNVTVGANDIQTAPCIGRSTLLMLGETKIYLTKNTRRLNLHSLNRTCILCRKPYQKGGILLRCYVMIVLYCLMSKRKQYRNNSPNKTFESLPGW